jgi:hypothetical protein
MPSVTEQDEAFLWTTDASGQRYCMARAKSYTEADVRRHLRRQGMRFPSVRAMRRWIKKDAARIWILWRQLNAGALAKGLPFVSEDKAREIFEQEKSRKPAVPERETAHGRAGRSDWISVDSNRS